jgi:hypothetical protein
MSGAYAHGERAARGHRTAGPGRRARDPEGSRQLRLVETTVLLLVALLLVIATVNDVVQQTHVNHRLVADLRTWRAYTGHDYHNLSTGKDFSGRNSTREVVCGNTKPGGPKARIQLCLVIEGPVARGVRHVAGGWYLPAGVDDVRSYRYGCYGAARSEGRCRR